MSKFLQESCCFLAKCLGNSQEVKSKTLQVIYELLNKMFNVHINTKISLLKKAQFT